MSTRARAWGVLLLLIAALTALAWSLGVTLEEDVEQPDHLWRPIDALIDRRLLITVVAAALAAVTGAVFARLRRSGHTPPDDVAVPLLLIGVLVGIGYSVVTAPTIGANIGGGLTLMGGPFVVLALAFVAARAAHRHRSSTHP